MRVNFFFDKKRTKTASYVITDLESRKCAIVDSVLDYDQNSSQTWTESADLLIKFIEINELQLEWILETHVHADHLTASHYIKSKLGGKIAIGENVKKVLNFWSDIFKDPAIKKDGSRFDYLFKDGEKFKIGNLKAEVIATPGHTPACISYYIEDYLFTGDTIFSPKTGTARTDFPGGSSSDLFDSVQKIYSLPDETKICVGHEYPEAGSEPVIITTVQEERQNNISINQNTKKEEYVERMNKGQQNLPVPALILPALFVNLNAGELIGYIKLPTNALKVDINLSKSTNSAGGCSSGS